MPKEKPTGRETHPEVIRLRLRQALEQQLDTCTQVRAGLVGRNDSTLVILEGQKFYDSAVRAIYGVLSQLNVKGHESVDKKEVEAFMQGLEDYLVPKKQ